MTDMTDQAKLEKSLRNSGKLTKKWIIPGEERHLLAWDSGVALPSMSCAFHFDPSFQVYTRVPYEADGELLVEPSTPEGKEALLVRAKEIAQRLFMEKVAAADDDKVWTRVIRVDYASAQQHAPRWDGGAFSTKYDGRGSLWNQPGHWAPRETTTHRQVKVAEARALGHVVTKRQGQYGKFAIPLDDQTGRGSDVVGPLLITRVEVNSDPGWAEALEETSSEAHSRRQGHVYGTGEHYREPKADPILHLREWEEDFQTRIARWEAHASRSESDQKDKPKRWRSTETASLWGVKQFPWNEDTWADLQHFQEMIRSVDRRVRVFMASKDDEFLALLSGGRLLSAPGGE
jgi:hypothetical protein